MAAWLPFIGPGYWTTTVKWSIEQKFFGIEFRNFGLTPWGYPNFPENRKKKENSIPQSNWTVFNNFNIIYML